MHTRFAPYYIRRVRADIKDPLAMFMRAKEFPCEPDKHNSNVMCFSFPQKAPVGATCTKDLTALDQIGLH